MTYTIRPAKPTDFDRIQEIYAHARSFMASTGNPSQWGTSNPPQAQTWEDIRQEKLYLVTEEENIHGVFFFSTEKDPTYAVILGGAWHFDRPYGVIHRIASDGAHGIVKAALDFAASKIDYLRIDTHEDNKVMQHVLTKNGFQLCGTILLANGDPRLAFDRSANSNLTNASL